MKRIAVFLLLCSFALSAVAIDVEGNQVMYLGGTVATLKENAMGRFDTTSPTAITYETSGTKLVIPYAKIESFVYSKKLARHLGVVATVAVVLVKHRQRRHFVTLTYRDESDVQQVAVFEVSKEAPGTLIPVLQAHAPELCKKNACRQ